MYLKDFMIDFQCIKSTFTNYYHDVSIRGFDTVCISLNYRLQIELGTIFVTKKNTYYTYESYLIGNRKKKTWLQELSEDNRARQVAAKSDGRLPCTAANQT